MGSPLLGNNDGPREYSENRCVCCWLIVVPKRQAIPVCVECNGKLSSGERAAIVFALQQTELLRDMRGHLNVLARNDGEDESQLARIARTFEEFRKTLDEIMKRTGGRANSASGSVKIPSER